MILNKLTVIATLTRDPEKKYTAGGTCVVGMRVAVSDGYYAKDGGGWTSTPVFIDVSVFGENAERLDLVKGDHCLVDGKLRMETWQGKDGSEKSKISIMAGKVSAALSWRKSEPVVKEAQEPAPPEKPSDDEFENLPF